MDAVRARYDAELANEYGNLASRTVAMIHRYRDGVVPDAQLDPELVQEFDGLAERVAELLGKFDVTNALERIRQLVRRCNRYVEERAPWQQARDPAQAAALDMTLATLAEALRTLTVLLYPYMPATTEQLLATLAAPESAYEHASLAQRGGGRTVAKLEPLSQTSLTARRA